MMMMLALLRKTSCNGLPLSIAVLLLAGCTQEHRDRWNRFWGLDQGSDKPIVSGEGIRRPTAPAEGPAVAEARPAEEAGSEATVERGDPRAINRYVRDMESRGGQDYQLYDHLDKMRRQQDPERRRRIRRAAANTIEPATPGGPDAAPAVPEPPRAPPAKPPTVRVASTAEQTAPQPGAATALEAPPRPGPSAPLPPMAGPVPGEPADSNPAEPVVPPREAAGDASIGAAVAAKAARPSGKEDPSGAETKGPDAAKGAAAPILTDIEISEAPPAKPPAAPAPKKPGLTPNTPPEKPEAQDTFARRLKALEERAARHPNDVEAQFRLRMMYLFDGRDEKALAPIEGVNADIQEIIQAQMQALIAARSSAGRDPAEWANRQLAAIEELRRRVRARADLSVPKVVLCTSIRGFGLYEPIDPPEFPAGRDNRIVIYIEVDNFSSKKTEAGLYRTLLSVRQSLLTAAGEEIWSNRDENIEDLARRPRRDFFLATPPITIPSNLPPGRYTLKVEVEDVQAGKINSGRAEFTIVP